MFWRDRVSLELYIYLYAKESIIELISYHLEREQELERFYFNEKTLYSKLDPEEIEVKIKEKKKRIRKDEETKVDS